MTTKTIEKSEYEVQADDFITKVGAKIETKFLYHGKHFDDDKYTRDIYEVTIQRGQRKSWTFKFGQSLDKSDCRAMSDDQIKYLAKPFYGTCTISHFDEYIKKHSRKVAPTAYDVLASIQKYDVGTLDDFCSEFGYSNDSIKAQKTYFAVQNEFSECRRMFGDCLDELVEIN